MKKINSQKRSFTGSTKSPDFSDHFLYNFRCIDIAKQLHGNTLVNIVLLLLKSKAAVHPTRIEKWTRKNDDDEWNFGLGEHLHSSNLKCN